MQVSCQALLLQPLAQNPPDIHHSLISVMASVTFLWLAVMAAAQVILVYLICHVVDSNGDDIAWDSLAMAKRTFGKLLLFFSLYIAAHALVEALFRGTPLYDAAGLLTRAALFFQATFLTVLYTKSPRPIVSAEENESEDFDPAIQGEIAAAESFREPFRYHVEPSLNFADAGEFHCGLARVKYPCLGQDGKRLGDIGIKNRGGRMKKQCFNPYLPSWEYIPDGEPYVFDGRVYVYGSHDMAGGFAFCLNDYVCWSAPADDLSDWRYEGVIYKKTADPLNPDGRMCLYAPDVTRGPDGRYYLYYVLDKASVVSVAVCGSPAGEYTFHGYVHYPDGTRLGEREGDEPQFDPGVLTEGGKTYMYTGFCGHGDKSRTGAWATVLAPDMLTVTQDPVRVVPGNCYGEGTGFEGHEYFEAASIRKHGGTYYFIYSSTPMHELCYATSKHPTKDFKYGGVIVHNGEQYPGGNNHGSMVEINGQWTIFYHRMTNGTWFSRQGCAERINIEPDGSIRQVEMTSLGLNGAPLIGKGEYPSTIACVLFNRDSNKVPQPRVTQYGGDGCEEPGYIADITEGSVIGFKYFDCKGICRVTVRTRAYCNGLFEVKTALDGEALGAIPVISANIWTEFSADITVPDGVHALYFEYKGSGNVQFASFTPEKPQK
jgi:hypothetical protein